jgi:hypothetical protein
MLGSQATDDRLPVSTGVRAFRTLAFSLAVLSMLLGDASAGVPFSEGWVSFDGVTKAPSPPQLHVLSSSPSELVVEIRTLGVLCTSVVEDEMEFTKLELPGYGRSGEVGHPALPAVRQLFALPRGAEIDVAVAVADSILYTGSVVCPVPAEVTHYTEEGWPYPAEEFAYDEQAYGRSGYYPDDTASAGSSGTLRDQGVAVLTAHPIRYDPVAGKTKVCPILRVTLTFTGGFGGVSGDLGPFDSIAERVLLNYTGFGV